MRFDELILAEDEYPHGPCESRYEWLLMYSRGVPVPVIARWCRVDVRRVRRAVERRIREDPRWFGRCLLVHDQPAQGTAAQRSAVKTRDETWWGHYNDLVAYLGERDRAGERPRQNDSPHASELYRWLLAQRRALDAGRLAADRLEALEAFEALGAVGQWKPGRKEDPEQLWDRRLGELHRFVTTHDRHPTYDPVRRPEERVLAVWLGRQRTWHRKGRLRTDRQTRLDQVIPHWGQPTKNTDGHGSTSG